MMMWRRHFATPMGVEPVKDYHLMMIENPDTHLIKRCSTSPCPAGWYIATLCPPNENCGDYLGCRVGQVCSYPTDSDDPLYDEDHAGDYVTRDGYPVNAVTIDPHTPTDLNNPPPGQPRNFFPTVFTLFDAAVNCELIAIRHTTDDAPFDGEVSAKYYLDEEEVGVAAPAACEAGKPVQIGISQWDEGIDFAATEVDHTFTEPGVYDLDIVVTFVATDTITYPDPVVRTHRAVIRIFDPDDYAESPTTASFFVMESFHVDADPGIYEANMFAGTIPGYGGSIYLKPVVLKGPFETQADAEYVLDNFSTLISDFASSECACGATCEHWPHDIGPELPELESGSGSFPRMCRWSSFGGEDDGWGGPGGNCKVPLYGEWDVNENAASVELRWFNEKDEPQGTHSGGSYTCPPCWYGETWALTDEEGNLLDGNYEPLDEPPSSGFTSVLGLGNLCKFCDNEDFDENGDPIHPWCIYHMEANGEEWDSDWDYLPGDENTPSHGVPNSSADVANHKEYGG
jgi:hypothetical protein